MKQTTKTLIQEIFKKMGIGITSSQNLERLRTIEGKLAAPEDHRAKMDLEFLASLPAENLSAAFKHLSSSTAQLRQDLFVLSELGFKERGYFVEFGATNGVDLSNTHLLEKQLGWTGIVAEPAIVWHDQLRRSRSCNIDTRCVWSASGQTLTFNEVAIGELSTVERFTDSDAFLEQRRKGTRYSVSTVSLVDLLDAYGAPSTIDYLSIDTEGSELEILRQFDFAKYQFRVITCEHNFTDIRKDIYKLLTANGYTRKLENISQWDDWYVRS